MVIYNEKLINDSISFVDKELLSKVKNIQNYSEWLKVSSDVKIKFNEVLNAYNTYCGNKEDNIRIALENYLLKITDVILELKNRAPVVKQNSKPVTHATIDYDLRNMELTWFSKLKKIDVVKNYINNKQ